MDTAQSNAPQVSIVIPMHNEEGAVDALLARVDAAARVLERYEIIVVDDGSTDATLDRLQSARASVPNLRILRHRMASGQSAAVHSGVLAARAPVCCTLDGDGQNPPENLPVLWMPLLRDLDGSIGLVAGQRIKRKDRFAKKAASQFANALRGSILGDGVRDTGCGLKAFRRDAFLALPYFDHMHRYLPALFKANRWDIVLVDVTHEPRTSGQSKYTNLGRAAVGVWDLLGVLWLLRRAKKTRVAESVYGD